MLVGRGYTVHDARSENRLDIRKGNVTNSIFLFGGKDEGSQDLVQGITLAGFFFRRSGSNARIICQSGCSPVLRGLLQVMV